MKQYLAVEVIDGHEYILVFTAKDFSEAEFRCSDAGDLSDGELEFCGEVTLSNVARQSDLPLPCDPEPYGD